MDEDPDIPPPPKFRRALRLVGWNALLLIAVLALIGLAGEAWLRSTIPVRKASQPKVFVPGVGVLWRPHTEIRSTNRFDIWTASRTNRLGFLDREPPSPERAAESSHVAMIGDSFVEASHVPIPEKFHVRLEEMATERGIPVIDQSGFILRQGAELRDAHWRHDAHWNPAGHRWAAEALLEYLKENQDVCG